MCDDILAWWFTWLNQSLNVGKVATGCFKAVNDKILPMWLYQIGILLSFWYIHQTYHSCIINSMTIAQTNLHRLSFDFIIQTHSVFGIVNHMEDK